MSAMEPSEIESRLSQQLEARRKRQRRARSRRRLLRGMGTFAALLVVGAALAFVVKHLPTARVTPISGTVRCSSGAPITGVWVQEAVAEGDFAAWYHTTPDQREAYFSYGLRGKRYAVHVGCGGTPQHWLVNAKSGFVTGGPYAFVCRDLRTESRYGSCLVADGVSRR